MMATVANQPRTPHRNIRVPDNVWIPAKEKAEREGRNLSELIRDYLSGYINPGDGTTPAPETYRLVEGIHYKRDGDRTVLVGLPKGINAIEF